MSQSVESILRLIDFKVMKSYFEVYPEAKSFDRSRLRLSLNVSLLQSEEAEHDMAVQLQVDLNQDEDASKACGFAGSMVVNGFFDVAKLREQHPDDWEPLLAYNGVTVLFGIVRSAFAELSGASPVGRLVVPTINVGEALRARGTHEGAGEDD